MYWKRYYSGRVVNIPQSMVAEGHCTSINKKDYKQLAPGKARVLSAELDMNFDLREVATRLGIAHLLENDGSETSRVAITD
jgi:hypothetical protein